jgi:uncharacterized protein (TIGR02679 family)
VETWDDTESRRDAWASVGVLTDELSAPALVLNLRASGPGLSSRALELHANAGEPYRISVRQLLRDPPPFAVGSTGPCVFVCENSTIVAACAHRLGTRCRPIVCVEGQPKTAGRLLLQQLRAAGIELAYHGDFDWPGIQIGNLVMRRHSARAWRFDIAAYRGNVGRW